MKGMKDVKLLVQQREQSRYGRQQGERTSPAPLLPYLLFILDYPGPLCHLSGCGDIGAPRHHEDYF